MENQEQKQGFKIVKINTLQAKELSDLKVEDLWVFQPADAVPSGATLCGCRNICIA
ncbi:hypothetical protein JI735_19530 [Paenibacillus sonchi]|uniref:Uncharacterized protein n=1 Tax=Paenibacillus sonchi TaxID=373687 RepID=A0A974P8U0_9BACL|nr:hypothetical protein [Paenibacillus sonchi]QQZ58923.1 hypothetical protein JI735_19530 [Paenibacillus sonchi]